MFPLLALCLCLLLLAPTLFLVVSGLSEGAESLSVFTHLAETFLWEYLSNTALLATGVVPLVLLMGVVPAWLCTRFDFPGRSWLENLLILPIACPTYILAYVVTDVFQYEFESVRSLPAAVVLFAFSLFPYVYIPARAAFLERGQIHFEAARTLGYGSAAAFFRVSLPLSLVTLFSGVLFVVMEVVADFGTVEHFAILTLSSGIYRTWFGHGSLPGAILISLILLLVMGTLWMLQSRLRQRSQFHAGADTREVVFVARETLEPWKAMACTIVCSVPLIVGFVFPVTLLMAAAATSTESFEWGRLLTVAGRSVALAAAAATLCSIAGWVLSAMSLHRFHSKRLQTIVDHLITWVQGGYLIPGTVLAVAVMSLAQMWGKTIAGEFLPPIIGTVALLLYAHTVRYTAIPTEHLREARKRLPQALVESGRTMGTSSFKLVLRIILPLMRPTAFAAAALVFVDVMKELPTNMLLAPFNFETLPVMTYNFASDERLSEAAPAALLIVLSGLVPVFILLRASKMGHHHRA